MQQIGIIKQTLPIGKDRKEELQALPLATVTDFMAEMMGAPLQLAGGEAQGLRQQSLRRSPAAPLPVLRAQLLAIPLPRVG